MKTVVSGVAPSGNLHIGNYLGALRQWVIDQEKYQCFFFVVDLHAITVPQDKEKLHLKTREVCALYLAVGIDPDKAAIFIQSENQDHASLSWILNCYTPYGQLLRMTQFKDKSAKQKEIITAGLFNYPVLMAADILLYQTDIVPVGEDQKQHLELTRDIAQKMNAMYGELFIIPQAKIEKTGARIMSLQNPLSKMSKSDTDVNGSLFLLDTPDQIIHKIKIAVTDSQPEIGYDPKNRPGIANLIDIYCLLENISVDDCVKKYQGQGYKEFKHDLTEIVTAFLQPIQEKHIKINTHPDYLNETLTKGLKKARERSNKTLETVSKAVGLGI